MDRVEPRSANDYDDRTTSAVKSVLVEIGQILGSFKGKFAVIGGAVPWLLLSEAETPHAGTADVDLALDAQALGDGEYVRLVELLQSQGYRQGPDLRRFQLARTVAASDGGPPIDIVVDFLMPRDAIIAKNNPPLVSNFAVQRADGAELALNFYQMVAIDGAMPDGGRNRVSIAVAGIPALLAMKGYAIAKRQKPKDAYDIILLRAQLSRRRRRPHFGHGAIPRRRRRENGIPQHCWQVPDRRRLRPHLRSTIRGRFAPPRAADARSVAAGRLRPGRRLARTTRLEVTHAHHISETHPHD